MGLVRILDAQSGQAVEVDDAEASRGIAEGRYRTGGGVGVRLRDGRVVDFESSDAAGAFLRSSPEALGIDTPEHAAERQAEREFGGRPLAAGALGALRAPTLGLSDVAIAALGGEEAARTVRELQERNPGASLTGELLGTGAALLVPGLGEATAERTVLGAGARALTSPLRTLAGVSERAGAAAARAIAGTEAGVARRLLARTAGGALEGAIDGSVGEAARILSEEALGDPDLTAEQVMARVGTGALYGAGVGGALGGSLGLLGEGGRLARESAEALRAGWAARIGTDLDPAVAHTVVATADAEGPDLLRRLARFESDDGRRVLRVLQGGDASRDGQIRGLRAALDDLIRVGTHAEDFARGAFKRSAVARRIDTSRAVDQVASARAMLARARLAADDLLAPANEIVYGGAGVARGRELARHLDALEGEIEALARRGDAADVYVRLDQLKRRVGQLSRQARREPEAARRLQALYDDMIAPLEDASMWGDDLAGMQREVNSAWTRYLSRADEFNALFTAQGERDVGVDPWRVLRQADPQRLASFLDGVGTAANDRRAEIFREVISARAGLGRQIAEHMDVPAELAAEVAQSPGLIARIERVLGEAEGDARIRNQWRAAREALSSRGLWGAVGGALYAGVPGALVGGVGPQQAVRALGMLQRMRVQTSARVDEAARGLVGRGRETARGARRALVAGSVAAYRERTRRLDEDGDPQRRAEALARSTADMGAAPRTRQAIQAAATRAHDYLRAQRPRGRTLPGELVVREPREPSAAERARFLRVARAVDDPGAVLDDLRSGRLEPESVEALRAVYPRLHAELVRAILAELQDGAEPSYQERMRLAVVLGVPTDPSLSPQILATLQASHALPAAQEPSAPPTQPAPQIAEQLASGTERLEARRG